MRVWEYDRLNSSVWQVDIFLPGNGALYVHPKVTNTRTTLGQGYWWTCVAVPVAPTTRVLVSSAYTAQTSVSPTTWSTWPNFAMGDPNSSFTGYQNRRTTDNSFLGAVTSGDFFMGPTAPDEHSISWATETGFVGYHGHVAKINGTKFFTWGQNGAGRFMQDFLGGISGAAPIADADRTGDYAELQVGPAFTQMQTFDVNPGNAQAEQWTEFFGAFDGSPAVLLGDDYNAALGAVSAWRTSPASGVSDSSIADIDAFLTALAEVPVDEVLFEGSPWGAVELARRAAPGGAQNTLPFPPGVSFTSSSMDAAPWLELLSAEGTFSNATLSVEPTSYQVSAEWLAVLRASAASHGSTWLHELHIAVILAEMGGVDEPRAGFTASLAQRPSAVAARCLAVLQATPPAARALFQTAWKTALAASADPSFSRLQANLADEIVKFELGLVQGSGDPAALAELQAFLAALPSAPGAAELAMLDSVLVARAELAVRAGDWQTAVGILTADGAAGCFPTLGSARADLIDVWFRAQYLRVGAGKPLSPFEQRNVRVNNPVPRNIGCPYGGGDGYPDCVYW